MLCVNLVASSEVPSSASLFLGSSLLQYRACDGKKAKDFQYRQVLGLPNTTGESFAQLKENTHANNLDYNYQHLC